MEHNADPAFRKAMDELMGNVHRDNIMAVHEAFQRHANQLHDYLHSLEGDAQIGLCGWDPVSKDVRGEASFGGKIRQLIAVHWAHCHELEAVAENLQQTARSYGRTEQEVADSVQRAKSWS